MNNYNRIIYICLILCLGLVSIPLVNAASANDTVAKTNEIIETVVAGKEVVPSRVEKIVGQLLQPVADIFVGNQWLQGIAVICVTFAVASFLSWVIFRLIRTVTRKTSTRFDDTIARLLRPPIYYSLLVTGISTGLTLMPLSDKMFFVTSRGVQTVGLVVWIYFFIHLASLVLRHMAQLASENSFVQNRTLTLFDNGAKIVIFGAALYLFFVIWRIDMTAWLASAGIAGIAIGFAAKDTLSNLFSGVFILADAPYKVGDYVLLGTGDRGKVLQIGLRSTRMLTRDDVEIIIPNSIIGNSTIINQSGGPSQYMRLRIKIGVAYGSDIDQVRDLLIEVATQELLVLKNPAPRVRFRVFGASSLDFELLCWAANPELRGRAMDALNSTIYKAFNEHGIEIPYAKQDLYIKNWPDAKAHQNLPE